MKIRATAEEAGARIDTDILRPLPPPRGAAGQRGKSRAR